MSEQQQAQEHVAATEQYDVAILGGGIAGLTLALQLKQARPATRILVIEKLDYPVPEATHKVGESTVEIAAHYLRDVLDLGEHLKTQQLNKFGLRMFFSADENRDITRRVELGHATLPPQGVGTYQLDRGRLEDALAADLPQHDIHLLSGSKVQQLDLLPQLPFHRIWVQHEHQTREIQARWLVDASGRNTLLQRHLGLSKPVGHHANAAWFRMGYSIDVQTWSSDPAWRGRIVQGERSLSTTHLMGPGYWVWLIRLASGSTSVGIVSDARLHEFSQMNRFERALAWLWEHEPQCAADLEQHRDLLQDFRVMREYAYSCEQVYSEQRWCLTGEAAVSLDPLYSPGGDLIAISNGLVCDLVIRHLDGEDIQSRAQIHNTLFLSVATIWLGIYEQQYSLMSNAQVMVAKIIWDTAFYWGIFGLLFFHDAFRNIAESPGIAAQLTRIALVSNRVQAFFREWHAIDQPSVSDVFVDLYSPLDFMVKLHAGMAAGLSHADLEAQFAANVRLFERLAGQMVSKIIETHADNAENEAVLNQIRNWQTDPFLAEMIALYRREARTHPMNSSWIGIGHREPEKQKIAR